MMAVDAQLQNFPTPRHPPPPPCHVDSPRPPLHGLELRQLRETTASGSGSPVTSDACEGLAPREQAKPGARGLSPHTPMRVASRIRSVRGRERRSSLPIQSRPNPTHEAGTSHSARGTLPHSPRPASCRRLDARAKTTAVSAFTIATSALAAPLFARGWLMSLVLIPFAVAGIEVVRKTALRESAQSG